MKGTVLYGPNDIRFEERDAHRVIADKEDDRDCRCCSFGRERSRIIRRGDQGYATINQIGGQFRQPLVVIVRPAILDFNVLPLDKAALA